MFKMYGEKRNILFSLILEGCGDGAEVACARYWAYYCEFGCLAAVRVNHLQSAVFKVLIYVVEFWCYFEHIKIKT